MLDGDIDAGLPSPPMTTQIGVSTLPPGDPDAAPPPGGASAPFLTIKANGVEHPLTQEQATELASKGLDYTAKTQDLADQRKNLAIYQELEEQLARDPQGTLSKLARAYQVDLGEESKSVTKANDQRQPWEDDDETDPLDERLSKIEERLAGQDQAAQTQRYASQLQAAAEILGDEFDQRELIRFAQESGIGNLEAAAAQIAYWEANDPEAQGEAQAGQAKRELPPVAGGKSPAAGSVENGQRQQKATSIREALEMAEAEVGHTLESTF